VRSQAVLFSSPQTEQIFLVLGTDRFRYIAMAPKETAAAGPGRPREFDIDEVVCDAMEVFQTRGYAGTSLVDLIGGTGLTRGSLYKAFKDKRTLFLAALDRYMTAGTEKLRSILATGSPLDAIRKALRQIARSSACELGRRGCLVVASATELAAKDKQIRQQIGRGFSRIEKLLEDAIRRGQETGEIKSQRDPAALSRFLLCTMEGMGVLGKTGRTAKEMSEIVDVALEAFK
jgi:TetR/AcrR family transcriptional regulator, transcriptional repressor for nem operon